MSRQTLCPLAAALITVTTLRAPAHSFADSAGGARRVPACGVASTFCVLKLFGHDVRLSEIEERFTALRPDVDLSRLSMYDLVQVLKSYGLHALAVQFAPDAAASVSCPAILRLLTPAQRMRGSPGHFAVLEMTERESACFLDLTLPAGLRDGRALVPLTALSAAWRGEAVLVSNNPIELPSRWQSAIWRACAVLFATIAASFGACRYFGARRC